MYARYRHHRHHGDCIRHLRPSRTRSVADRVSRRPKRRAFDPSESKGSAMGNGSSSTCRTCSCTSCCRAFASSTDWKSCGATLTATHHPLEHCNCRARYSGRDAAKLRACESSCSRSVLRMPDWVDAGVADYVRRLGPEIRFELRLRSRWPDADARRAPCGRWQKRAHECCRPFAAMHSWWRSMSPEKDVQHWRAAQRLAQRPNARGVAISPFSSVDLTDSRLNA